ncbi:MAG: DinB family protein [Planctomycetales bacterium]|nr:DinB family protein [Planctomycetales bacterium]
MSIERLIDDYAAGPERLRQAISGMSDEQLDAKPIPGTWSTRQVVCHVADFEPIYADRMKRVIAEDEPTFFGGDPDVFASRLAYAERDVDEELNVIDATRRQLTRILTILSAEDFQRNGNHFEDGPLSLETLLSRITGHVPHHVNFIEAKRDALGL